MVRRLSRASTARAGDTLPARAPGGPRPPVSDVSDISEISGVTDRGAGQGGAQTLELALLIPAVVAMALTLVLVALAAVDLIGVQALAREGARAAARGADPAEPVHAAAGGRDVQVQMSPRQPVAGQAVTVTVRLRSRLSDRLGVPVWLPAQATMLREPGP